MSALTPLPTSLFGGTYNGSLIPHGLVTFSSRFFLIEVFQRVCLLAQLDPDLNLVATVTPDLVVISRLDQAFTTAARIDDNVVIDAELLETLALDAVLEDC